MKEPIEYLGHINSFTTREELYEIGKQMQIDAWNEAIKIALENATAFFFYDDFDGSPEYGVNKNSILKLLK